MLVHSFAADCTLDNEPVNEYGGKVKLGSELAVSYDNVRGAQDAFEFTKR